MSTTIAQLDSKVYQRLGGLPPEWLPLNLVHISVVQALNVKTLETRLMSDVNLELSTTAPFTPTTLIHDITSLIGKSVVAWVEQSINGVYYPVEVVGLAQLAEYSTGRLVCAIWSEKSTSGNVEPTQYIQFNIMPTTTLRIRFDSEAVSSLLADLSLLPDNLQDLIVMKAENSCIPRIKLNASLNLLRNEERRQDFGVILNSLDGIYTQNVIEIQPLENAWKVWAFRDRGLQTPFTKATPSGRSLYDNFGIRY